MTECQPKSMSEAAPSVHDEQIMSQGSSPSRGSPRARPKPRKYPSFTFRRGASKASERLSMDDDSVPQATRTRSESEAGTPNSGKLFHVRVTLGYLKAVEKSEKGKSSSPKADTSLVTAFASLDPQAVSSEQHYAPSMPLSVTSSVTNIVWPRQKHVNDGTPKSARRLYFSTVLQRDEDDVELRQALSREDDVSTVTGTSGWNHEGTEPFAPQLVKIQLGVARGNELVPLGVATLVVDGTVVTGKQMDLPVRTLIPGEDGSTTKSSSPKRRGLKRMFGKKSKSARNLFSGDGYEYRLTPNALLRVRVDVISDTTPFARIGLSGPAVWGDGIEDDNDSFASIVITGMNGDEKPEEELSKARSQREETSTIYTVSEASEGIEVVDNPTGPSIISAPPQYEEPDVSDLLDMETHYSSVIVPVSSIEVETQNTISPTSLITTPAPTTSLSIFRTTGMLCGFADSFSRPGTEAEGCHFDFEDSSTIATSLYNGTRGEAWKTAGRRKSPYCGQSVASSGILHKRSLGTVEERTEDNSRASMSQDTGSRASASQTTDYRSTYSHGFDSNGNASIGQDTARSLDEAKKALQTYAQRKGENYRDMLQHLDVASSSDLFSMEDSVGEDTIDSVFEAKNLLQSYASRVGLDVQDLLEVDVVDWIQSFATPMSTLGTKSADETEGTNNTSKSSRSRFSLFVDD